MSKLPSISDCRGMSEPFYFSFNIDKPSKPLICHAVIFASFVMDDQSQLNLCTESRDPRMQHFIQFVWENFLKEKSDALKKEAHALKAQISQYQKEVALLRQLIETIKPKDTTS